MLERDYSASSKYRNPLFLVAAVIIAVGLKVWLQVSGVVPFNSDEAIVALMAKHILQGARPIFFYGQAYMGSLDAWLVAAGFWMFGETVFSIRVVQIILYGLYLISLWVMLRRFFKVRLVADFGVLLASIPPVLLTTYTSATLGGYGEVMVLGNLVLLLGYEVVFGKLSKSYWAWLILGLLGGIGFWTLGMMGIYLITVVLVGLWKFSLKSITYYVLGGIGFVMGSAPWWLYNLFHEWGAFRAFFSSGLVETTIWDHLLGFVLFGVPALVGLRPPWTHVFAPWPILLLILILLQAILIFAFRCIRRGELNSAPGVLTYLGSFGIVFSFIFISSQFGIDSTGRYFLPLYIIVYSLGGLFVAYVWQSKRIWAVIILIIFLGVGSFETWRAATSVDKITTQFDPITRFDNSHDDELVEFLYEQGQITGYSNYWVAYRLAFLSGEQLVYSPRLPYKADMSYTSNDNRYPAYDDIVAESENVAYITSKHPQLDMRLRQEFAELGVDYQEKQIGVYLIFYNLSHDVRPDQLELSNKLEVGENINNE